MTSIAASRDEQQRAMPGDGLVSEPMFTITHAITIDAPPERVWPWLSQMGSLRGGWYSYDWTFLVLIVATGVASTWYMLV